MKEKKYTMRSKSFRTDFFYNRRHVRKTHAFFIQNKLNWHIYRLLRGRTISEKLPQIPLFFLTFFNSSVRLLGSQQHPQSGVFCFSLWYEFFVPYALRVGKKMYRHGLGARPLEFQFLRPRGSLTNAFRTLSLCFEVMGKTPGLISRNNFVKKFLSASAIAIMSWPDVTRSSPLSGVKEC